MDEGCGDVVCDVAEDLFEWGPREGNGTYKRNGVESNSPLKSHVFTHSRYAHSTEVTNVFLSLSTLCSVDCLWPAVYNSVYCMLEGPFIS